MWPPEAKIVVAPIASHVEINNDKRDNDGGNTEAEDVADVVSRDALPCPRRRRVELRGFGAFSVRVRRPHSGRNPRTGATVDVAEKVVPYFKTAKEMRNRINYRPLDHLGIEPL